MAAASSTEVNEYEPSFIDRMYDNDFINGQLFPQIVRSYTTKDYFIECFKAGENIRCISVVNSGVIDGSKMVMICFHGNSCDLGDFQELLVNYSNWFQTIAIGVEYSGYGLCEGDRTPRAIIGACTDAIVYIRNTFNIPLKRMILYGHSVGGAIALQINNVFAQQFGGLILHNTFSSIKKVVSSKSLISSLFISDSFLSNIDTIKCVKPPQRICIIHGQKDEIIPESCSKELYDACPLPLEKKSLFLCPNSSHNAFNAQTLRFLHISPFFRKLESECFDNLGLKKVMIKIIRTRKLTEDQLKYIDSQFDCAPRSRKQQTWIQPDGKCHLKMNVFIDKSI